MYLRSQKKMNIYISTFSPLALSLKMVKGGKDRSFRLTRRKKRKFAVNQFTKSVADTLLNANITEQEEQMSMLVDNEIPGPNFHRGKIEKKTS